MTSIGFISDVHSNEEALDAVLADMRAEKVFCLGDIVGYGASPNEVVEKLRRAAVVCVRGNHDQAVVSGDTSGFNGRAALAAIWTKNAITPQNMEFLAALPTHRRVTLDGLSAYLTHGSPDDNLWEYVHPVTHETLFDYYLERLGVRALGVGHLHVPFEWRGERGVVFNPGSVGQPRDGDRRASYSVVRVDEAEVSVENFRVEYDFRAAAEKIVRAGLPERGAARLSTGT
jgi:putative phosphoesterase